MNTLKGLAYTGVIIAMIFGVVFMEIYRFEDCKKVGHGIFYCILNIGK